MQQKSAAEMSRAELAAQAAGAVVVEIYGQVYQLRGTDNAYIEKLAAIVDGKMRAVSAHGATVDSLRVAVLAALNLADELARAEERLKALEGTLDATESASLHARAANLTYLLDSVLEEDSSTGTLGS